MSLRINPSKQLVIPIDRTVDIFGIPICRIPQGDGTNWCWAACVKMILDSYRLVRDEALCAIATQAVLLRLPGSSRDCCQTNDCECQQLVSDCVITQVWAYYRIPISYVLPPPAGLAQNLLALLRQGYPVELAYQQGSTSHVVILYGWAGDTTSDEFTFYYHDPADRSKNHVAASRIGDNGDEGELRAFWEIRIDATPDSNCDEQVKMRNCP